MQKNHADSEKFTVVLSFAQQLDQEATDFLRREAAVIPAYDQMNPPGSPCGDGIPDAYLFDHTGKLVRRGHPAELYPLVAGLIDQTPDPIPPGILGAFQPIALAAEAALLSDPTQRVSEVLDRLERLASGGEDPADEARALVDQVRGWLPSEVERLEKLGKRRPGKTAFLAEEFLSRFKGVDSPLESRVLSLQKELTKDANVRKYVKGQADLARAAVADHAAKAAQFERRGRKVLEQLLGDAKVSDALKKDARAALDGEG